MAMQPIMMHTNELTALHQDSLIADTECSDSSEMADSCYSSLCETPSLAASIWDYQYENGRRYHRTDEKNLIPNDETEQDRLDLHHHIFLHLLGGQNYLAPLKSPLKRILDIGTGTGIWAVEMAEEFPEAEVIATDTTPIQPNWVFSNCHFEIDDAEKEWTWPDNHFDYIHSRNLAQGIHDWPRYLQQMYRCCKPGGYIELMELHIDVHSDDNSIPEDSAIMKVSKLWGPAAEIIGLKVLNGEEYAEHARNAGFTDIKIRALKQPWNKWPKNKTLKYIGNCMQLNLPSGIHSYHMALFTRILQMPPDEATSLLNQAVRDSANRKMHIYNYVYNVVARKPFY